MAYSRHSGYERWSHEDDWQPKSWKSPTKKTIPLSEFEKRGRVYDNGIVELEANFAGHSLLSMVKILKAMDKYNPGNDKSRPANAWIWIQFADLIIAHSLDGKCVSCRNGEPYKAILQIITRSGHRMLTVVTGFSKCKECGFGYMDQNDFYQFTKDLSDLLKK